MSNFPTAVPFDTGAQLAGRLLPMTSAVRAPGDISDEFDDDALRETIERAESAGEWRDADSGFVDPKLAAIEKQLAEPEREATDYAERRRRELQRRAAAALAEGDGSTVPAWSGPVNTFTDEGRATTAPGSTAEVARTTTAAATTPGPSYVGSRRSAQPVWTTIRPLLTGFGVFVPVAAVQVLLAGWHPDVALRTTVAALVAGLAWQRLDAERFCAVGIGVAVHLLAFFLTSLHWTLRDVIANGTGLVGAMLGALVVGGVNEWRHDHADRP